MWVGIPYTTYGYRFSPSRKLLFCAMATVLYMVLSLPDTYKLVGSLLNFEKYDDNESNDRYYLVAIHSVVFLVAIYFMVTLYNPSTMMTLYNPSTMSVPNKLPHMNL
jgi:hypothetical protein